MVTAQVMSRESWHAPGSEILTDLGRVTDRKFEFSDADPPDGLDVRFTATRRRVKKRNTSLLIVGAQKFEGKCGSRSTQKVGHHEDPHL